MIVCHSTQPFLLLIRFNLLSLLHGRMEARDLRMYCAWSEWKWKYKQKFFSGVSLEILLPLILSAKQDGRGWKVQRGMVITRLELCRLDGDWM